MSDFTIQGPLVCRLCGTILRRVRLQESFKFLIYHAEQPLCRNTDKYFKEPEVELEEVS